MCLWSLLFQKKNHVESDSDIIRAPIKVLTWVAEGAGLAVVEGAAVEGWGVEGCRQCIW